MKLRFLIFISAFFVGLTLFAQCPFGNGTKINCVHGCGRFIDENKDGFCDHGLVEDTAQSPQKDTLAAVEKTQTKSPKPKTKDAARQTAIPAGDSVKEDAQPKEEEIVAAPQSVQAAPEPAKTSKPYPLITIAVIVMALYAATALLVRAKVMRKITHRRIWNVVLLIAFIGSCIGGLYLVFGLNYGWYGGFYASVLKIHVWFGIVMTLIGLIHILWHIAYFKRLFIKKGKQSE
ncbi:MAG: hypothetical protein LBL74_06455 [Bacteroidales bacterium]|jgi:hypothetical protein|nr:hypothetical protein [Bacteroidales bacterium]